MIPNRATLVSKRYAMKSFNPKGGFGSARPGAGRETLIRQNHAGNGMSK